MLYVLATYILVSHWQILKMKGQLQQNPSRVDVYPLLGIL